MAKDNDKEFEDLVENFKMVEPLSLASIVEGLRCVTEACLYIEDFLSESFVSVQDIMESFADNVKESNDVEFALNLDLPLLDHDTTVYLTLLFNTAKNFCDSITEDDEDDEYD